MHEYMSCSDVENIQAGIGNKLVLFLNSVTTFISGFVIAFFYSWKMALVMCSVLPPLVLLSALMAKVTHFVLDMLCHCVYLFSFQTITSSFLLYHLYFFYSFFPTHFAFLR